MFKDKKSKIIFFTFIFLFALHITPATYINSNFLSQYFGIEFVGFFYIISSFATIFAILGLREKLRYFGNYKIFISALLLETLALGLLVFINNPLVAIASIIFTFICQGVTFINLDIFLEKHTSDDNTGQIRGLYLSIVNAANIIGPFIASILLTHGDFKNVYLFIFILLFPIILFATEIFKDFKDGIYDRVKILPGFKKIKQDVDLYSTIMSNFILQFFYGWMVIYMPILLYKQNNFSLSEATLILSIALIPFVLTQRIAGRLADKFCGEKEMMSLGFLVMAFTTGAIAFLHTSNISVWIAILFFTRIGASVVEIMTETHIFKRISDGDLNVISVFRILTPTAYISGAILGSLFLHIISLNMLFLILAGITLYGLRYSLAITDTK